jgi:hypothetical protein
MVVTWVWEIRSGPKRGRLVERGTYPARPWACHREIADEQMALWLRRQERQMQRRWPRAQPSQVLAKIARGRVCVAWREDDPETVGESRGDDWVVTAARARRSE